MWVPFVILTLLLLPTDGARGALGAAILAVIEVGWPRRVGGSLSGLQAVPRRAGVAHRAGAARCSLCEASQASSGRGQAGEPSGRAAVPTPLGGGVRPVGEGVQPAGVEAR